MQLTGFLRDIFFVPLDYFPWNHLISCQLVLEHTYRVFNRQVVDFILYRECLNPWEVASEPLLRFIALRWLHFLIGPPDSPKTLKKSQNS